MANIISKNLEKKEFRNTLLAIILAFFVVGFYMIIPSAKSQIMLVFLVMLILAFMVTINFKKLYGFATYKPEMPLSKRFLGIGQNPIIHMIFGGIAGFVFIWLTSLKAFAVLSLAIPSLPYSVDATAFVVRALAPLVETLFFVNMLHFLWLFMPFGLALFFRAIVFSGFHVIVYLSGTTFSAVSGAFFGAFFASIMFGILSYYWGMESDLSSHVTANSITYARTFGSLSVVG